MIDLAAQPYRGAGWMQRRIREQFGLSPVRFYQRLNRLVGLRAAIEYDPQTCRRIRDLAG